MTALTLGYEDRPLLHGVRGLPWKMVGSRDSGTGTGRDWVPSCIGRGAEGQAWVLSPAPALVPSPIPHPFPSSAPIAKAGSWMELGQLWAPVNRTVEGPTLAGNE